MSASGSASHSQTVILLHGLGAGPESWQAQLSALPPGLDGIAPRIAGTADGAPFTMAGAVTGVIAELDERDLGRAHLCGLSLGAMVAVQVAVDHPDRVASLVLSGGQVRPPRFLMAVQRLVMRLLPARLVVPDGTSKARVMQIVREVSAVDAGPALAGIAVPTLVLVGSKDRANQRGARALAAGIPGARLRTLAGGHELTTEAADAFNEAFVPFLQAHATP